MQPIHKFSRLFYFYDRDVLGRQPFALAEQGIPDAGDLGGSEGVVFCHDGNVGFFARAAPQDLTVGAIADGTAQEVSAVIDPLTDDTAVETAAAVDTTDTQAPTGKNYGEAQMVSVSKDSGAEFFESARLARRYLVIGSHTHLVRKGFLQVCHGHLRT